MKSKPKKTNRYQRNHKQPIPALYENPRYTGACRRAPGGCEYCKGEPMGGEKGGQNGR